MNGWSAPNGGSDSWAFGPNTQRGVVAMGWSVLAAPCRGLTATPSFSLVALTRRHSHTPPLHSHQPNSHNRQINAPNTHCQRKVDPPAPLPYRWQGCSIAQGVEISLHLAEIAKENEQNRLYLHQYAFSACTTIANRFRILYSIGIRHCQLANAKNDLFATRRRAVGSAGTVMPRNILLSFYVFAPISCQ